MKTILRKNLLRFALFAFVIAFTLLLVSPFKSNKVYAGSEYENAYVGEEIVAGDYEIAHNGEMVTAESMTVVYPSGGVYGGDKFTMSQAGKYQITYHATVDGEAIEETRLYMAVRMPQNLIVTNTEVVYGKYEVESPYEIKTKRTALSLR